MSQSHLLTSALLLAVLAPSAAAQDCYSLQQLYTNAVCSTVEQSGRLTTLTSTGQSQLAVQRHDLSAASGLYVADPAIGNFTATGANANLDWNIDAVGDYVIAGTIGFTGAPGNAFVMERTTGTYTAATALRFAAAAGTGVPTTSRFAQDVAIAGVGGSVLAFVGDPGAGGGFGGVYVLDVTTTAAPIGVAFLTPPGLMGTADVGFSVDVEENAPGGDATVRLLVGAPGDEIVFDCAHCGAAYLYEIGYDTPTNTLFPAGPTQIANPYVADMSATSFSVFGDSVAVGADDAVVSISGDGPAAGQNALGYGLVGLVATPSATFTGATPIEPAVAISQSGDTVISGPIANGSADSLWTRTAGMYTPFDIASIGDLNEGPNDGFLGTDVSDAALSVKKLPLGIGERAVGLLGCGSPVLREFESTMQLCTQASAQPGFPNSTGAVASVNAGGLFGAFNTNSNITVTTTGLPNFSFGYQLTALGMGYAVINGNSALCIAAGPSPATSVGAPIQRHFDTAENSGNNGTISSVVDLGVFSQYAGFAGERLYFQTWHRDSVGGVAVSNFSDAIGVRLWD